METYSKVPESQGQGQGQEEKPGESDDSDGGSEEADITDNDDGDDEFDEDGNNRKRLELIHTVKTAFAQTGVIESLRSIVETIQGDKPSELEGGVPREKFINVPFQETNSGGFSLLLQAGHGYDKYRDSGVDLSSLYDLKVLKNLRGRTSDAVAAEFILSPSIKKIRYGFMQFKKAFSDSFIILYIVLRYREIIGTTLDRDVISKFLGGLNVDVNDVLGIGTIVWNRVLSKKERDDISKESKATAEATMDEVFPGSKAKHMVSNKSKKRRRGKG